MSCPMCGKPTSEKSRPFCSKRCADLDLARWLNGYYAIPSNEPEDQEALEEAMENARIDPVDRRH